MIVCEHEGHAEPSRSEILSKLKEIQGVDGILWATHERLDAEVLDRAGAQLKVVSTKTAGIDYVDVAEVKRRGIPLGCTPNSDGVADLAIGLMVAAARRFLEGYVKIVTDNWEHCNPQWMVVGLFNKRMQRNNQDKFHFILFS